MTDRSAPETVAIDLRTSIAVGPPLRLLERLTRPLSDAYDHSTLRRALGRLRPRRGD